MKLKTLTFRNKKASVIWMLILALALVFVDYFLSPVVSENDWQFEEAEKPKINVLKTPQCIKNIRLYQSKNKDLKYPAQGCLSNGAIIFVKESPYKGEIFVIHKNKSYRIAVNLQLPRVIVINSNDEIYIWEQGRERVIKFWKK